MMSRLKRADRPRRLEPLVRSLLPVFHQVRPQHTAGEFLSFCLTDRPTYACRFKCAVSIRTHLLMSVRLMIRPFEIPVDYLAENSSNLQFAELGCRG